MIVAAKSPASVSRDLTKPPQDRAVTSALQRLHRYLEPVSSQMPFRQVALRLRRRATLLDEMRAVLRLQATPAHDPRGDYMDQGEIA